MEQLRQDRLRHLRPLTGRVAVVVMTRKMTMAEMKEERGMLSEWALPVASANPKEIVGPTMETMVMGVPEANLGPPLEGRVAG